MTTEHSIPRIAVSSIGSGALLMALFTTMWALIANHGYHGRDHHLTEIVFIALAALFVVYAFTIFKTSKQFPEATSDADIAEKKRSGKWFGVIFGLEGIFIPIAVNIVIALHHPELIIPSIALVVGLHFFPLARVFKRNVDYYLATWTTIIAITAMMLLLKKSITELDGFAFVGTGVAIATSCYGLYMISNYRKLVATTKF
ncbi:hypothetical protein [Pinibacter aurantiacus]|uniref:Uncharacterized protein n=1 Tax=Pinibacter aurantiacus TaxID=2851599 RepID=A0A9E2W2Y5_9BACT|nr:hypothetical protein [Pinibacter aurantiacus]MBV4356284.1 hypothetical protein [Pinibacter aurantiacus]